MSAEWMYILGVSGLVIIFGVDLFLWGEFKSSFSKKDFVLRNSAYIVTAISVLFVVSKTGKIASEFVPFSLEIHRFPVLDYVGCFLVAELLNYLIHFLKHSGFLWRFHFQHHLSERYNTLLTTHTHGPEVIISGFIISILMGIIGFGQEAINTYFLFYSLANSYQHMSRNLSLGFLDYIIVSPRYHRVHHSKKMRANYGSTLTFWDIIFRTAYFPQRHEIYKDIGIEKKNEPFGFLKESIFFLKKI
jgi:sterol desaturase/sphingolipid hydroxylase (fatty acid hydroxylase superfamily)